MKTQKKTNDKTTNAIPMESIEEWLKNNYQKPEDILGKDELIAQLTKRAIEQALARELTNHLGSEKGERLKESTYKNGDEQQSQNCRNGSSRKRLITKNSQMEIAVPRDQNGSFEPLFNAKGQRRFSGFDERILAMYGRGMTVRDMQNFLLDHYQVEVSAKFISTVTDSVMEEIVEWQNRPLDAIYPVIFFDAMQVKIRDAGVVKNKAVYFALAIQSDGQREVLGFWIEQTEGAKFWLKIMNELSLRGVKNILIAVVDGLKGFPETITTTFPEQIRKIIYTTNAIENLHRQLRKVIKNRGHFPSDEAASKLLYLALKNITQKWEMPPITWNSALNQFAILYPERFCISTN